MGSIMGIRWNSGKLQVQYFPCCDWVNVEGMTGIVQDTGSTPTTDISFLDWVSNQFPPLPSTPGVPHTNPDYTTVDSKRCAKATAFVNEMYDDLDVVRDILLLYDIGTPAVLGIAAALATGLGTAGVAWGIYLAVAAIVYQSVSEYGIDGAIESLDQFHDDDAMKSSIICQLVDQMVSSDKIEDDDVKVAVLAMNDALLLGEEPGPSIAAAMIKALPAYYWKLKAQGAYPDTECGCEQYLPNGYTPPVTNGALADTGTVVYAGVTHSSMVNYSNQPYDQINLTPQGTKVGAGHFRTKYSGSDNAFGQLSYYSAVGILIKLNTPATINNLKFDLVVNGVPSGASFQTFKARAKVYVPATGWVSAGGSEDGNLNPSTQNNITRSFTAGEATHVLLTFMTGNANANLTADVKNIRLTGTVNGQGFLDLPLGQAAP